MSTPVLCTIDQRAGNGGIARVSAILWRVIRDLSNDQSKLIALFPSGSESITAFDKVRFATKVIAGQLAKEFDWLFFDHLGPATVQGFVPRVVRRPYGVFLHSVEAWRDLTDVQSWTLKQATVRIANSKYTAQRTLAAHGEIGNIEVCHLALFPDEGFDPAGMKICDSGLSVDYSIVDRIQDNSVLIVGRMMSSERHKGHEQLIRAWPSVKMQVPDAQLVIVGRGDDLQWLKGLAGTTGCRESIIFAEWVNDVTLDEIYRRAAVFAMPSNGEGFGLVFLEAMKRRLPCIASCTDASREIVVDGETGFLVDQSDGHQICHSITLLLKDRFLRKRFGSAGFGHLNAHFSFEKFKERINLALGPLLQSSTRRRFAVLPPPTEARKI
jgi:phosphatidylinositol alpha-1,6-mannosyltransferase